MTPSTLLSPARHDATELKGSFILDAPRTLIFFLLLALLESFSLPFFPKVSSPDRLRAVCET